MGEMISDECMRFESPVQYVRVEISAGNLTHWNIEMSPHPEITLLDALPGAVFP